MRWFWMRPAAHSTPRNNARDFSLGAKKSLLRSLAAAERERAQALEAYLKHHHGVSPYDLSCIPRVSLCSHTLKLVALVRNIPPCPNALSLHQLSLRPPRPGPRSKRPVLLADQLNVSTSLRCKIFCKELPTHIVASQDANHFAVAVELHKQPLFHVLEDSLLAGDFLVQGAGILCLPS
jgi:hypothetical protein